jgi:hypothetical protein
MDKQEKGIALMMASLDDLSGALKLVFTLSTGAVVLFVRLLTEVQISRWEIMAVGFSTFLFSLTSMFAIGALTRMGGLKVQYSLTLMELGSPEHTAETKSNIDELVARGKRIYRVFKSAVAMAMLFVVMRVVAAFWPHVAHLDLTLWR